MKVKICKYMRTEYKGNQFIEVKMTLLGFLFRNSWAVCKKDFDVDYKDRWVPCYVSLKNLIRFQETT